jgi:hypothetical protein
MTGEERGEVSPYEQPSSRSTFQPFVPYLHDLVAIFLYSPIVPRDAIVGLVTLEYRRQPGVLFACRPMPASPAPILDRGQQADAVEALWQHMHQEAADELVGIERPYRSRPSRR